MDPPEKSSIEKTSHRQEDPVDHEDATDDPAKGDDDESEDDNSSDHAGDDLLKTSVDNVGPTGRRQEGTDGPQPSRPPQPSPLKAQLQSLSNSDLPLTTSTFTTSSSTSTSSSPPHSASALSDAGGTEREGAILQNAMNRFQRMFSEQMLIMHATMNQHQAEINERLEQKRAELR